jgi:hypothetical protein
MFKLVLQLPSVVTYIHVGIFVVDHDDIIAFVYSDAHPTNRRKICIDKIQPA